MKPSKIRNSLKKGVLLVTFQEEVYKVTQIHVKRVVIVSETNNEDVKIVSAQDVEFHSFTKMVGVEYKPGTKKESIIGKAINKAKLIINF
jgi:hypothetical protein